MVLLQTARLVRAQAAARILVVSRLHLATAEVDDARVSETSRFVLILSVATAPDEFPAQALVLTVRGALEVEVGAADDQPPLPMFHRFCCVCLGLGFVHRPIRVVGRRVERIHL